MKVDDNSKPCAFDLCEVEGTRTVNVQVDAVDGGRALYICEAHYSNLVTPFPAVSIEIPDLLRVTPEAKS